MITATAAAYEIKAVRNGAYAFSDYTFYSFFTFGDATLAMP
jgi:hypothetical protein